MNNIEEAIAVAAETAHNVNRMYCIGIGDLSQPTWDKAPGWQRESAASGVRAILDNPAMGPESQHEQWLKVKREEGWTYGPVKDAAKKEHPCFVPFDELSYDQRAKDVLFGAAVRGVLAARGLLKS